MRSLLSFTIAAIFILGTTSCEKFEWGKDKKGDGEYEAVDFKQSDYFVNGAEMAQTESIDLNFYWESKGKEKEAKYKLVSVFKEQLSDGTYDNKNYWYEIGTYEVDQELNITFYPEGDDIMIRQGWFQDDKSILYLTDNDIHSPAELRFVHQK